MPSRRHCLHFGDRSRATRRASASWGRTPLWACGVTSLTPRISSPAAWSERIAVSRPEPGPFTKTSTFCRPCSMPLRAHESAVTCAANGVDLREPLNPAEPADSHAITLPSLSVRATIVLLNDVLMCAWPIAMFLRTRRRVRPRVACRRGGAIYLPFLPRPTVFFGPLRVRAFVFVRWPLTGRLRRWRMPRYEPISCRRLIACERSRRRSPSTWRLPSM